MDTTSQSVLAAITSDIDCHESTEWFQGFSPKEHLEMNLLEVAKKRDDERAVVDRLWRESQAEREHNWRKEDMARDREWRNEDRDKASSEAVSKARIEAVATRRFWMQLVAPSSVALVASILMNYPTWHPRWWPVSASPSISEPASPVTAIPERSAPAPAKQPEPRILTDQEPIEDRVSPD